MNRIRKAALLVLVMLTFAVMGEASTFDHEYRAYADFLAKYVTDGLVDYRSLARDRTDLDEAVLEFEKLRREEYDAFSDNRKIACLINAYNLFTIKAIVDNYPVKSIKDIGGVWNRLKFKVAGEMLTLDNIEHDRLRKKFSEPRIHVAIVCASISCPALWELPFTPNRLDEQLAQRARAFAADSTRNFWDSKKSELKLSKILKWYGDDFVGQYREHDLFPNLNGKKLAGTSFVYMHLPADRQREITARKIKVGKVTR